MAKVSKKRQEECKAALLEWLKPGDTVHLVLRHVSRSGMYRAISLLHMEDGYPRRLDGYASDLLEGYDKKHEACRASGCGMDMGFHLVYTLGHVLFGDGYALEYQWI